MLPRLSRLSMAMAFVGVMVEESSWLFLGYSPAGEEIWSAFPLVWVQSPSPAQLVLLPSPVLGQVLTTEVVSTALPLPPMGPAVPEIGERLTTDPWIAQLLDRLGLVRDPFR